MIGRKGRQLAGLIVLAYWQNLAEPGKIDFADRIQWDLVGFSGCNFSHPGVSGRLRV
jgi:hypothetical protein